MSSAPTKDSGDGVLLTATGQKRLPDAVAWIAEGHPLIGGAQPIDVLPALAALDEKDPVVIQALRRAARSASRSNVDTSSLLFDLDAIPQAARYRQALDRLAVECRDGNLENINVTAVIVAQRADSAVISTLCAVAGIGYKTLCDRVDVALPGDPDGSWTKEAVAAAFHAINEIVSGAEIVELPGAAAARPVELIFPAYPGVRGGWRLVELMRCGGVPYEILLMQREVGSAWNQHRSGAGSQIGRIVAGRLRELLDDAGVEYHLARGLGGIASESALQDIVGAKVTVGLVVVDASGKPAFGVCFSTANDGGSVRRPVERFAAVRGTGLPMAVVLIGLGWAQRNETADLAVSFQGRLYTQATLERLTRLITTTVQQKGDPS
jgi:hypothetical protein